MGSDGLDDLREPSTRPCLAHGEPADLIGGEWFCRRWTRESPCRLDEKAAVDKTTLVHLTDTELALLDGQASAKVQVQVAAALARLQAAEAYPDLTPRQAGFVADVVSEANENGEVILHRRRIRHCSICGRSGGYYRFKSGYRKGENDYKRPLSFAAFEMARRFVTVDMHVSVGGCEDCVTPLLPLVADALRGVPAEVPARLRAEGEPERSKHRRYRCTVCEWRGHEGQMGRSRTLIGDGTYPSTCPSCGAENRPLGKQLVEWDVGWVVTDEHGEPCGQSPEPAPLTASSAAPIPQEDDRE